MQDATKQGQLFHERHEEQGKKVSFIGNKTADFLHKKIIRVQIVIIQEKGIGQNFNLIVVAKYITVCGQQNEVDTGGLEEEGRFVF